MNSLDIQQEEPKASTFGSVVDCRSEACRENLSLKDHRRPSAHSSGKHQAPGSFRLLYESRDGRLCIFEDNNGHITAVRSDRFA